MLLTVFVTLLLLYSLVSQRLERTVVTAPIVFTLGGMLAWLAPERIAGIPETPHIFLSLAEIGLVLLLYTDASRTDLNVLRSIEICRPGC